MAREKNMAKEKDPKEIHNFIISSRATDTQDNRCLNLFAEILYLAYQDAIKKIRTPKSRAQSDECKAQETNRDKARHFWLKKYNRDRDYYLTSLQIENILPKIRKEIKKVQETEKIESLAKNRKISKKD